MEGEISVKHKRFEQTAEEITVTFIPQCSTCVKNINYHDCKEFIPKPLDYTTNRIPCPKKVSRTEGK